MTLTDVGTRYNGMEAVAWKGGSFFQPHPQPSLTPNPSPKGEGSK